MFEEGRSHDVATGIGGPKSHFLRSNSKYRKIDPCTFSVPRLSSHQPNPSGRIALIMFAIFFDTLTLAWTFEDLEASVKKGMLGN